MRAILHRALIEKGLQGLVRDLIAPLNMNIGEAWIRGDLGIPDEHFYTEQIQSFLRGTLAGYARSGQPPRVLLTTMPEEEHALGLLMVEVMLATEGAQCCSLGPRMPLSDIRASAVTAEADIVALSFSSAFPAGHCRRARAADIPARARRDMGGRCRPRCAAQYFRRSRHRCNQRRLRLGCSVARPARRQLNRLIRVQARSGRLFSRNQLHADVV